jgi:DNA-binding CsgD family transcriptional regulator
VRKRHQVSGGATAPPLTTWGVSADADLMYRCMTTLGAQSAAQLERALGIPRHRVSAGLDELLDAGAARPRTDRPHAEWAAAPVPDVVSSLRRRRHPRAGRAAPDLGPHQVVERLLPGSVPLGDGMRHLPSRALARARLGELVGLVRHEHMAMSPERTYEAESARAAVPMDRKLLLRGVRMRVLGAQPAAVDPLVAHGRAPDEPRPAYREWPDLRMKLVVLDRRVAMFPVSPADLDRGYLEVTEEPVVAQLAAIFEEEWAAAEPRGGSQMPQILLTEREQSLVDLLVQGHTDSSAARQLRVSRRTVSTTVGHLMDKLGVTNRFQLGVALGALHIVPRPGDPSPSTSPGEPR